MKYQIKLSKIATTMFVLGALLPLQAFLPQKAHANSCTVAFGQQTFTLQPQTTVQVSTDCNLQTVSPPVTPPPPPNTSAGSTWFNGNVNSEGLFLDRVQTAVNNRANPANVGAGDFTLEIWLKPTLDNQHSNRVSEGTSSNWYNGNIWLDRSTFGEEGWGGALDNGRVVFAVRDEWRQKYNLIGGTDLRDGAWHFVQLVRRGNTLSIYVDGQLEDSAAYASAAGSLQMPETFSRNYPNSNPYHVLGAEKHDYDAVRYPGYWGGMYDMRLSNVARDPGVPTGPMTTDSNTVMHWRLDDVSGGTDLTGNGNDGTFRTSAQGYPQIIGDAPF